MSESPRKADPEHILRRLEWTVIRRLDGLLQGDYRTLFRGFGLDLADLREYQYQDDVRHIDWNVTARLQTPYVREYYEDLGSPEKVFVDLACSSHNAMWEKNHLLLFQASGDYSFSSLHNIGATMSPG